LAKEQLFDFDFDFEFVVAIMRRCQKVVKITLFLVKERFHFTQKKKDVGHRLLSSCPCNH